MTINYLGEPQRLNTTNRGIHYDFSLDSASDLSTIIASDYLTTNRVAQGSTAYVNSTKKAYVLSGSDAWVEV